MMKKISLALISSALFLVGIASCKIESNRYDVQWTTYDNLRGCYFYQDAFVKLEPEQRMLIGERVIDFEVRDTNIGTVLHGPLGYEFIYMPGLFQLATDEGSRSITFSSDYTIMYLPKAGTIQNFGLVRGSCIS